MLSELRPRTVDDAILVAPLAVLVVVLVGLVVFVILGLEAAS